MRSFISVVLTIGACIGYLIVGVNIWFSPPDLPSKMMCDLACIVAIGFMLRKPRVLFSRDED